jgi:hypothetical protein
MRNISQLFKSLKEIDLLFLKGFVVDKRVIQNFRFR